MELKAGPGGHVGKTIRRCTVAGLRLTEAIYPAGLKMPSHGHEFAYFSMVLQGAFTESVGQNAHRCQASTMMFHPPEETHRVEFHGQPVRIFRVEVENVWLDRIRQYTRILDRLLEVQGGIPACLALRLYHEFQTLDSVAPLAMEGLTLEILASASRQEAPLAHRKRPPWLQQARDCLEAHFTENLTVEEVALAVGVHPVHLARTFRRHFHCTMGDYVRRLRIDFACRQLTASGTPLSQLALTAGFADQGHFSRTFKQFTGLTPNEYKKAFASR